APDAERTDLPPGHRRTVLVDDLHRVAGDRVPERPGDAVAWTVREEDVERLGGAETVDDLLAEPIPPLAEDRRGQRLPRRQETPELRQPWRRLRRRVIEERPVGRGHGEEESRPLLGEEVPGPCGRKGVRREHDRGPRAEREVQSAEPVGEEELRGRV